MDGWTRAFLEPGHRSGTALGRTTCRSMIVHARRGGRPLLPATLPETEAEPSSSLDPTQQASWRAHCMQVRLAAYPRDERIAREATPSQPPVGLPSKGLLSLRVCSCDPNSPQFRRQASAPCASHAPPLTPMNKTKALPQGPNTGGLPPLTARPPAREPQSRSGDPTPCR
ncbi:hypothetical protein C8Q76DRAFT_41203 [Earliella scabrosa]|nr:hypothetical protein C8Q76DRAFT_41203 [Earliella scabrosa]